jgi:hypothetical protein
MRFFIVIYLVTIFSSFTCSAEDQKVPNDDSKGSSNASLCWQRKELVGYTYRNIKDKSEVSYTFSDKDVIVAITSYDSKSDSFISPLVGPLNWTIGDKGILNIDGSPVFKWTASWIKVEEHEDKVVVINKKGEKETYFRAKINKDDF